MRRGNVISWIIVGCATAIALALVAVANNRFYQEFLRVNEAVSLPARPAAAWIEIDFGNGTKRLFQGTIGSKQYSLSSALESAGREGGFTFRVERGVLDSLGGVSGKWEIYRNGVLIDDLFSELTIRGGERYSFRLPP